MSGLGITKLVEERLIENVPPFSMQPWAKRLSQRCKALVPPWTLDHCWVRRRGLALAESKIEPGWQFIDIASFFTSIEQDRLWRMLRGEPELLAELRRFVRVLGCDIGVPEGCAFSPALANIYLGQVDKRWQLRAVRYGDNIASAEPGRLSAELGELGLATRRCQTFVRVAGSS